MKRLVSIVVVALLLGAGVWGYLYAQGRNSSPKYRLVQVEQGPLTAAVSATGNLNAVIIVQVGSQVSGQIKELLVDFNSVVKKGQTIARIDPQIFEAQVRVQEAALKSAHAQVDQKTAALAQAQTNLDYTTIRAPVDGIVVSRAVDVGQTVAASLQAPTLFTIAQDLTKRQVETSVDEADIGRVKLEDRATFTVDAFSGQTFSGIVTQIRKAAQIVQNVVTYTVVISVDNPGGRLLPGMTANVKLVYAEKPSVLKVPNAALRFRPAGADAGPVGSTRGQGGAPSAGPPAAGQPPRRDVAGGGRSPGEMRERLVTGLGLSAEQQKKLDPILADTRQQMMALRGLPEGERQARAATIREATRAKIREILPPEQRAKYEELAGREGRSAGAAPAFGGGGNAGRVWILDTDGKPKAVALTLGLSDGTATEVLRGDLKEGQEVITGLAAAGQQNRPGTSGSTPGGPRLRL